MTTRAQLVIAYRIVTGLFLGLILFMAAAIVVVNLRGSYLQQQLIERITRLDITHSRIKHSSDDEGKENQQSNWIEQEPYWLRHAMDSASGIWIDGDLLPNLGILSGSIFEPQQDRQRLSSEMLEAIEAATEAHATTLDMVLRSVLQDSPLPTDDRYIPWEQWISDLSTWRDLLRVIDLQVIKSLSGRNELELERCLRAYEAVSRPVVLDSLMISSGWSVSLGLADLVQDELSRRVLDTRILERCIVFFQSRINQACLERELRCNLALRFEPLYYPESYMAREINGEVQYRIDPKLAPVVGSMTWGNRLDVRMKYLASGLSPGAYKMSLVSMLEPEVAAYERYIALREETHHLLAWAHQSARAGTQYAEVPHLVLRYYRDLDQARVVLAGLRVEQYRIDNASWPTSLNEVFEVAPRDARGHKLRLLHTAVGVTVYSVGADGIDAGGESLWYVDDTQSDDLSFRLYHPYLRGGLPPPDKTDQSFSDQLGYGMGGYASDDWEKPVKYSRFPGSTRSTIEDLQETTVTE